MGHMGLSVGYRVGSKQRKEKSAMRKISIGKRFLLIAVVVTMLFSLAACGEKDTAKTERSALTNKVK